MLKAIAVQEFFEWIHKPVVIASDDLVTLDARTLAAIEDKIRGNGKVGQALAAQMQSRQLRTLCLPVASLGGTDPMTSTYA
jgi:GTP:adenosylcobinamide-phosphate guanylyltransferase